MRIMYSAFILMLVATFANGCGGRMTTSTVVSGVDRASVEATMNASWDALGMQDLGAFTKHVRSDWHLYTARGNRISAAQLFTNHQLNMTNFDIAISNVEIHLHGNVAWVTYDGSMSGLWQGEIWGGDFVFTSIFERNGAEWILIHTHESRRSDP